MSDDRGVARRVAALTAALVVALALGAWALAGPAQAAGALVGGAITIGNFLWLAWTADRAVRGTTGDGAGPGRPWLLASGARFGVVALVLGLAAAQGWLGLPGLLVSLTLLPVSLVAQGLRAARAA